MQFWLDGADAAASVRGEVILSAGSIGSPQLLELSGIGRGEVLQAQGIALEHALPGVGENLQDHLQIRTIFKVENTKTLNQRANSLVGKAMMGLEYLLFKSGPLTMAPSQLGAFAKSNEAQETPNVEFHVQPLSLDKFGDPLHDFPAFTASICNLRPESRGTVHINSADPRDQPAIRPNYLSVEADQSIQLARKIAAQPALARFNPQEYKPGPEIASNDELAKAAGDIATTIFHPVSTCKMGQDDLAVVDSRLRVHGIQGLRVADASIMPTITSGNTNSPSIMIGEKAAQMILADRGAPAR